jgi:hypothetical protein
MYVEMSKIEGKWLNMHMRVGGGGRDVAWLGNEPRVGSGAHQVVQVMNLWVHNLRWWIEYTHKVVLFSTLGAK